jgi:polyribonucleotide nucleotidyltransferase
MIPKPSSQTISLTDGREITIETGKLAKQAHGSVVIKWAIVCSYQLLYQVIVLQK